MKRKRLAELLLPTNVICATITICCYFIIDSLTLLDAGTSILRSLIFLEIIFIAAAVVCFVILLKDDQ